MKCKWCPSSVFKFLSTVIDMKLLGTLHSMRDLVILLWCIVTVAKASETDRLALLAIKSQIHDPLGATSSWNGSVDLCDWKGVTCGLQRQRVVELNLSSQSIGGTLSPYIGNLSYLSSIYLQNNSFYGQIPPEIGRLSALETLALDNNSFSGTIPSNLSRCSNLIQFFANRNNLEGEIPAEIGNLLNLKILSINNNHLNGQLPASIGNLSALLGIDIKENINLNGRIPDTIGRLRSLTFFNAAANKFSGMVPPSLYNISSLEMLALLLNEFHGSLPLDIGFTLPNLKVFSIAANNFTGSIPVSFSNASNLVELNLADNQLSGEVSIDFSGLKNLVELNLGDNYLGSGIHDLDFLTSLTNCSTFVSMGLYNNQFRGVLPHSIANLSRTMTIIAMGYNQISGTIPPGIGNLVNLNAFGLESNKFITGPIPYGIGDLKNLGALNLEDNNLEGSIPDSLGNLTILTKLSLGSNNLQGNLPSSLGNCQNLILLSVPRNKLINGTVPPQILGITSLLQLDLSDNLVSGSFPLEVGNLKNLLYLDVSNNRFSGGIPATLGGCTSLEILAVGGNAFSGSIPQSLSSLRSIIGINLSGNNFSGQIPKYFENLSFLEFVDLSYNHFEGEVPTRGVFSKAENVSLIGNEKLCGGVSELHLPSCQSQTNRPMKSTSTLLKVLIPVIAACLILLICFIVVFTRRRKLAKKASSVLQMEEQFPIVSFAELSKATNEFSLSNMIGQGHYGLVYKGTLGENKILVAVKVFNLEQKGASKSFLAECKALRSIRHRNLVKIITICSSIDFKGSDFKALVYEYMQNGSLEDWLHQSDDQPDLRNLSLIQRLNIAIDVAHGVEYLHHHCQPPVVHGDLKPSNILLDHAMVAHVGDFGLARFLSDCPLSISSETQSSSAGIKGTVGYVAPEYGMGGEVCMQGDVYGFGILLLEMFTGRRPTDNLFNDGLTLHGFAMKALDEQVIEIVEPSLLFDEKVGNFASHKGGRERIEECLISVVRTGVLCSMESAAERMEMKDVVTKLCTARKNFLNTMIR